MIRRPPRSTLFPYTPLFRSERAPPCTRRPPAGLFHSRSCTRWTRAGPVPRPVVYTVDTGGTCYRGRSCTRWTRAGPVPWPVVYTVDTGGTCSTAGPVHRGHGRALFHSRSWTSGNRAAAPIIAAGFAPAVQRRRGGARLRVSSRGRGAAGRAIRPAPCPAAVDSKNRRRAAGSGRDRAAARGGVRPPAARPARAAEGTPRPPSAGLAAWERWNPSGSTPQSAPAPVLASARAAAPMFCELRGRCRTNRILTWAILRPSGGPAMDPLHAQLPYTLREADFPALGQLYRGKVRDNYSKGDRIVMITTDRLSAFDRVLTTVPFKGELLNRLTVFWFEKTKHLAPNHILDVPDPSVLVVRRLQPLAVEMVVRGYITGSLWRDFEKGKGAAAYSIHLPKDLRRDQKFDQPILTPSTKQDAGSHDEPISAKELVARGTITQKRWEAIARMALHLFSSAPASTQN